MSKGSRSKIKIVLPNVPGRQRDTLEVQALVSRSKLRKIAKGSASGIKLYKAEEAIRNVTFFTTDDVTFVIKKFLGLPEWYVPFGLLRYHAWAKVRSAYRLHIGIVVAPGSIENMEREFIKKIDTVCSLFHLVRVLEISEEYGCLKAVIDVNKKIIVAHSIPGRWAVPAAVIWHSVVDRTRGNIQRAAQHKGYLLRAYGFYRDGNQLMVSSERDIFTRIGLSPDYLKLFFAGKATGSAPVLQEIHSCKCSMRVLLKPKKLKEIPTTHDDQQTNTTQESSYSTYGRTTDGTERNKARDAEVKKAIAQFRRKLKRRAAAKELRFSD